MSNNTLEYTIESKFHIAKKKTRILAFIIDFFIYCIVVMLLGYSSGLPIEGLGFVFNGSPVLVVILVGFLLWPMSEGLWGQTIGKRILNIKVLNEYYEPIEITASLARFTIGFIDCILLIGFIVSANNKNNRRIGDIVANTIVVQLEE